MENLYLNGYIKQDKIWEALQYAKYQRKLVGIEDRELRAFLETFNEVLERRKTKFLTKLDQREISEVLALMRLDHTDIVNERDLQTIGDILLDKTYRFN